MTHPDGSSDPLMRKTQADLTIQKALNALRQGDRRQARSYAEQAARLARDQEEPWLILAALSSPHASLSYLERALQINPNSTRARRGIEWAKGRLEGDTARQAHILRKTTPPGKTEKTCPPPAIQNSPHIAGKSNSYGADRLNTAQTGQLSSTKIYRVQPQTMAATRGAPYIMRFAFGLLFFSLLFIAAAFTPYYYQSLVAAGPRLLARLPSLPFLTSGANLIKALPAGADPTQMPALAVNPTQTQAELAPANLTASPIEATLQPSDTPFVNPSITPTSQSSPTPVPTHTPLATETATQAPTLAPSPAPTLAVATAPIQPTKKAKQKTNAGPGVRPVKVTLNDRWIAVDLSAQTTYAMQGDEIIRTFIVSTGAWPTVTIQGVFKIYVKYVRTNMTGPGYSLPNVPYAMFFFEDYGLHGTYWHDNFGTPMSHGCVNMRTDDAAWLYDFAPVGTYVSIHS